jgi:hypothetical protein
MTPNDMPRSRKTASASNTEKKIFYRLHIQLLHIEPAIWRDVVVPGSIRLSLLHIVLQLAMGWDDAHMHEFVFGSARYGLPDPDPDPFMASRTLDEERVTLADALSARRSFVYIYDFGDDWYHAVKVTKERSLDPAWRLPVCLDGARACPPEDCGGSWRYATFLEAIGDPSHEEHEEMLEWFGDFDPETFDRERVNQQLARIKL